MAEELSCGAHRAYAYSRGGAKRLFEMEPLELVRWNRIRDDISRAEVVVPTSRCCERLDELRTVLNELHIYRNGERVWEGPILRLEYEFDHVRIFAEDVLWQSTRSVINPGYNCMYPNMCLVLDIFDMLMYQCYQRQGDPWNMLPGHLRPIRTPDEPVLSKMMHDWQDSIFNEIDMFAENFGVDYTVVNRDIYYWDLHQAWAFLEPLQEEWISDHPRIVEYGNSLFTRGIVTNGRGWAGVDQAGDDIVGRNSYGFIDNIVSNANEDDTAEKPSDKQLLKWQEQARKNLSTTYPAPVGVVVPDNTTLMPTALWNVNELIPGAWFKVNLKRMCRTITEWNRLQEVKVEETAERGEVVTISSVSAPKEMHRV